MTPRRPVHLERERAEAPAASVSIPDALEKLSSRVRRLRQDPADPEKFFAERSDIAAQLQRLACQISGRPEPRKPTTT